MYEAYIGLGSNLPAPEAENEVRLAIEWLRSTYGPVRACEPYRTAGEGKKSAGKTYTNAVAAITTTLSTAELDSQLKAYETSRGRRHDTPEVTIDADIVIFDNVIIRPVDFERHYFAHGYRLLKS